MVHESLGRNGKYFIELSQTERGQINVKSSNFFPPFVQLHSDHFILHSNSKNPWQSPSNHDEQI